MAPEKITYKQLCLFDNELFREFFRKHPECTVELLRIILGKPNLRIIRHRVEKVLKNDRSRGVRLDIFAEDTDTGALYNIEMQKTDDKDIPKRSRYYSSMIDAKCTLDQKEPFGNLPESYVIFICKDDIIKTGKPLYHFTRQTDDDELLGDESHIVIVNGNYEGEDELGRLIGDLKQTKSEDISNKVLSRRFAEMERTEDMVVTQLDKAKQEWKAEGIAEGIEQGISRGIEKGQAEASIKMAKRMLAKGKYALEEIAEVTELPLEKVKELAESLSA